MVLLNNCFFILLGIFILMLMTSIFDVFLLFVMRFVLVDLFAESKLLMSSDLTSIRLITSQRLVHVVRFSRIDYQEGSCSDDHKQQKGGKDEMDAALSLSLLVVISVRLTFLLGLSTVLWE